MNYSQFTSLIEKQIRNLSHPHRINLAIDICNKLFPEYETFSENHQWGQASILKEAIDFCILHKDQDHIDGSALAHFKEEVERIIPDTEDFGDYDESYALNASASVVNLLDYLTDRDPKHVIDIVTLWTDTVDFKIHEKESGLTHEQADEHPKMQNERLRLINLTK